MELKQDLRYSHRLISNAMGLNCSSSSPQTSVFRPLSAAQKMIFHSLGYSSATGIKHLMLSCTDNYSAGNAPGLAASESVTNTKAHKGSRLTKVRLNTRSHRLQAPVKPTKRSRKKPRRESWQVTAEFKDFATKIRIREQALKSARVAAEMARRSRKPLGVLHGELNITTGSTLSCPRADRETKMLIADTLLSTPCSIESECSKKKRRR